MSIVRHLATGALLAALTNGSAFAATTTLFDNISASTNNYTISTKGNGPLAQSFFNDGSASFLETLSLNVKLLVASNSGSFVVTLNSDATNTPGSLLATLGTITDSQLTTTAGVITLSGLSLIAGTALTASDEYWIELSGTSDSQSQWLYATTGTGTGTPGISGTKGLYTPGLVPFGSTADFPFEMSVVATDTQDVPEPATLAVLGASLVGLGWARSRRKASTQKG